MMTDRKPTLRSFLNGALFLALAAGANAENESVRRNDPLGVAPPPAKRAVTAEPGAVDGLGLAINDRLARGAMPDPARG